MTDEGRRAAHWRRHALEIGMARRLREVGLAALGLCCAHGCKVDQRDLDVGGADASLELEPPPSLPPGVGLDAGAPGPDAPLGARLSVEPAALELGSIALDLAAVRSVLVSNMGDQVLAVPAVSLAAGSAAEFSILRNGCLDPLAPGAVCPVIAQFLPVAAGAFTGTLLVATDAAGTFSVPLGGTGLAPGDLLVSAAEGSAAQFGNVLLGQSGEASFDILNPASAPSGPLDITLNNPDFVIQAAAEGECTPGVTDLPAGASCALRVAFTPERREASEAILTVTSPALGSSGLRLEGVGRAPASLGIAQEQLAMRAVLGQAASLTVSVENLGDEAMNLVGASVEMTTPDVDYTLAESGCAGPLEGDQSCDVVVEFRPVALGARPATLVVTPESGEPLRVPIDGEGLKPGALVVASLDVPAPAEGEAVDFGAVRVLEERAIAFRVTNPGATSSGLLEQIAVVGDFGIVSDGAAGECSTATSLGAGEGCDLRVGFRPLQRGARDGSLTIVSVGAGSVALPLRGAGALAADITASPDSLQLGSAVLGEALSATVTVSNGGDEPASPPAFEVTGPGAEAFAVSGCEAQLEAGASCELTVAFRPTNDPAHAALLTPLLNITSASGGVASVSLTARGLRPGSLDIAAAAGATTAFQAAVNASQTQLFNITNSGGVDSGALSVSVANPAGRRNFELAPSGLATACQTGQQLAPGASCSVGVVFRPITAGASFAATLSVTSSGAGSDSIALSGVAQALATLSSPDAAASFPNGSESAAFAWRIDNDGDVATAPLTLGALPAGFTLAATSDCPLEQAAGLPPRTSCQLVVQFTPTQQAVQGQDQVLRGTITLSAGTLTLGLGVSGTIPRALAGRGQVCVVDSDCEPGVYSFCGSSGRNDLPNVCCDSACDESSCNGCSAGAAGGTCGPLPQQSECVTTGTSRAGMCLGTTGVCTEFCITDQSVTDQCLLAD